jgi:hypothetical protein
VAGGALEADGDPAPGPGGVAPGADLVRGVHAAPRRVVGEHQGVLDLAPPDLVGEEVQAGDGEGLVGGRGVGGALDAAVVVGLELLEDGDLVPAGVHEDRAVLGGRDVPLQALEDEGVLVGVAGLADVGVDLLDADPCVRGVAVVGDDQPVHAVPGALADLVDDAVLAVVAVLGVDVVVAGEPEEAVPAAAGGRGGGGRGCGGRSRSEDAPGRQARAEQTGAAQQGAARALLGGEGLVGYGGVEGGGQGRRGLVCVVVPVVVMAVCVPVSHEAPPVCRCRPRLPSAARDRAACGGSGHNVNVERPRGDRRATPERRITSSLTVSPTGLVSHTGCHQI